QVRSLAWFVSLMLVRLVGGLRGKTRYEYESGGRLTRRLLKAELRAGGAVRDLIDRATPCCLLLPSVAAFGETRHEVGRTRPRRRRPPGAAPELTYAPHERQRGREEPQDVLGH